MHLLAITPGRGFQPEAWGPVLASGVDGVLVREPDLAPRDLLAAVRWCQDRAPGLPLWVAGRLDAALAAGCGLHAPEAHPEVPPGLVPVSRPLHAEAQWDLRRTADQLLVSPILATPGKGAPWGSARLRAFLDRLPPGGPRLLALGGIGPDQARDLAHPRLDGVAAIRAFWEGDPRRAVAAFREAEAGA